MKEKPFPLVYFPLFFYYTFYLITKAFKSLQKHHKNNQLEKTVVNGHYSAAKTSGDFCWCLGQRYLLLVEKKLK